MVKPKARRLRSRRRYSWSLHFPSHHPPALYLSGQAAEGLRYMHELAAARRGETVDKLTVRDLAAINNTSRTAVYTAIKEARYALFGDDLSDAGIYYRLRRQRQPAPPANRPCQVQGCAQPLPSNSTVRRRYCTFHAAPASRVRRHRANKQPASPNAKAHDPNAPVRPYRRRRPTPVSRPQKVGPPWLTEEFLAKAYPNLVLSWRTGGS